MTGKLSRKALLSFAGVYLFLFVFNYLHPLNFGDDYIFSFVWQGKPMTVPLTEDAARVSSIKELLISQWSLYFTWGGRTVGQTLTQFFLWLGKGTFNVFNSLISTILIAEIYWCIHKGKINLDFNFNAICGILFLLWTFTPGFSSVFLWLTAACIYLWTHTLLLAFTLPYIQKYYNSQEKKKSSLLVKIGMLLLGIMAGWTNENSICWIILLLLIFIYKTWKADEYESWMGTGLLGLFTGYALLILAPGNVARLQATHGLNWLSLNALESNFRMLLSVLTLQLFLWYFNLKSLYKLKLMKIDDSDMIRDIFLVRVLCLIAFCASAIMVISPVFPARSGFFGTLLLIISAGILLRIQNEHAIELISKASKKFLFSIGTLFFVLSVMVSLYNYYKIDLHMQDIVVSAEQWKTEGREEILIVDAFKEPSHLEDMLSGFHIPVYELSDNENDWKNVDFARYYGISGIRMRYRQ